jgi:hypothetical protein
MQKEKNDHPALLNLGMGVYFIGLGILTNIAIELIRGSAPPSMWGEIIFAAFVIAIGVGLINKFNS